MHKTQQTSDVIKMIYKILFVLVHKQIYVHYKMNGNSYMIHFYRRFRIRDPGVNSRVIK